MTLAKIVVSGKVTKNPEKRFTQNNVPITSFVMDINPNDETLVRVTAVGSLAEKAEAEIQVGNTVLVDGRPQIETFKSDSGKDKRYIEINATTIETIGAGGMASSPLSSNEEIVKFSTQEGHEQLIDEEEIPF